MKISYEWPINLNFNGKAQEKTLTMFTYVKQAEELHTHRHKMIISWWLHKKLYYLLCRVSCKPAFALDYGTPDWK